MVKMIVVTTPKGKKYTMPESVNKAYYESVNAGINDPAKKYKIEPYVEPKPEAPKAEPVSTKGKGKTKPEAPKAEPVESPIEIE